MEQRERLINKIIDIEWDMLSKVHAANSGSCQERPHAFRLMRWMSHSVLSEKVLESYLDDLQQGVKNGRNFMIEKYARMEDKLPVLNDNPIIDEIVQIEKNWKRELSHKYPEHFPESTEGFENYFSCELETYSDRTIELYFEVVRKARAEGRNLVEERYNNLFKKLGYDSIEDRFGIAK